MRTAITMLLAAMLLLVMAADKPKDPEPTFRPGADVAIELTVKAPKGWQINYLLPLEIKFDAKQLKDAAFTVDEDTLSFPLKEYVQETSISIPVQLKANAKAGKLAIPFSLNYSICESNDNCSFNLQDVAVEIEVEPQAPKGAKGRALAAGNLLATVQLYPAAI